MRLLALVHVFLELHRLADFLVVLASAEALLALPRLRLLLLLTLALLALAGLRHLSGLVRVRHELCSLLPSRAAALPARLLFPKKQCPYQAGMRV
jgi:hypothetical protein